MTNDSHFVVFGNLYVDPSKIIAYRIKDENNFKSIAFWLADGPPQAFQLNMTEEVADFMEWLNMERK